MKTITEKKNRLDGHRPLSPALVQNLDDWFRVELTYTSNGLEGNTLTRRETALVVEKGLTVGGKSLVEHLEVTGHARALDWVKQQVKRKPSSLVAMDILHIHDVILKGIDDANAGHYRDVSVPDLMASFVDWLSQARGLHPVALAAEAHYQLVTIHPFVDGNGRTARLLMNLILLMHGYPAAIIRKRDRLAYISSLEKAQMGGSKDDYLKIITRAVDRSLDIYLKAVNGEVDNSGDDGKLLKIGELAKQAGESNSTLRHWTKAGLLEVAEVTEAGYQMYAQDMVARVELINRLKAQRLSLSEVKARL